LVKALRIFPFLGILLLATCLTVVSSQETQYEVERQWILIWINQDGSIDLQYNLTVRCISGSLGYFLIGQPNEHFSVLNSTDSRGRVLNSENIVEGDNYQVKVNLASRIYGGESETVLVLTRVDRMIWEDKTNPGNAGMEFLATYWPVTVVNLRVGILLPPGVPQSEVRNDPPWDNVLQWQDRLMIYWERRDLQPNGQLKVGISFPKQYVSKYFSEGIDLTSLPIYGLVGFILIAAAIPVVRMVRRQQYSSPKIGIEALGIRRGLTAIEAASLLGVEPRRILTMIVFSLMQKNALQVYREPNPADSTSSRLHFAQVEQADNKGGQSPDLLEEVWRPSPDNLRWYEPDFLRCIRPSGELDEGRLATIVMRIRDGVDLKMRGYCREETIHYYKGIVEKAWEQVNSVGTPELVAQLFTEQLDWLSLDPKLRERSGEVAERMPGYVLPGYWWPLWIHLSNPNMPSPPPPVTGSQVASQPVPIIEFANSAVSTIERTSNSIVTDVEKFVALTAPRPAGRPTSNPAVQHRSGCVCACASCACACACVSCACACASGGAR
jgi:hypothetical protein